MGAEKMESFFPSLLIEILLSSGGPGLPHAAVDDPGLGLAVHVNEGTVMPHEVTESAYFAIQVAAFWRSRESPDH